MLNSCSRASRPKAISLPRLSLLCLKLRSVGVPVHRRAPESVRTTSAPTLSVLAACGRLSTGVSIHLAICFLISGHCAESFVFSRTHESSCTCRSGASARARVSFASASASSRAKLGSSSFFRSTIWPYCAEVIPGTGPNSARQAARDVWSSCATILISS